MVDVSKLCKNDRLLIKEEGEYYNSGAVVYENDLDSGIAYLSTIHNQAQLYNLGIYNAKNVYLVDENSNILFN